MTQNNTTIATGWALVWPSSYHRAPVVECGANATERGIWTIGLGWPSEAEIAAHRRNGVRAVPVRIVEQAA
jgi:ATP-dependent Lon protease